MVYGTVKGFKSWNPVWANFEHWAHLFQEARQAKSWPDRLWLWFAPPEWRPAGLEPYEFLEGPTLQARPKWGFPASPGLVAYIGIHLIPVFAATTAVLWFEKSTPLEQAILPASLIVWTTFVWGGFFEGRSWARPMEAVRLLAVLAVALQLSSLPVWALPALVGLIGSSVVWLVLAPGRGWLVLQSG